MHRVACLACVQASWHAYCDLVRHDQEAGLDATPESHARQVSALQHTLGACSAAAHLPTLPPAPSISRQLEHTAAQLTELAELVADESSRAVAGRFEWVDGVLARAIAHGGWVMLDNANLCNPTVMDRLNPLLEPGGVLFMAECGSVGGKPRVIIPHPDFRLILALDPRHGEVSRAMRNRGIELFLLPPSPAPTPAAIAPKIKGSKPQATAEKEAGESGFQAPPTAGDSGAWAVLATAGAAAGGRDVLAALANVHARVCAMAAAAHRKPPTLADLGAWAGLACRLLARGWPLARALREAWSLAYLGSQVMSLSEHAAAEQAYWDMCGALPALKPSTVAAPDAVTKMDMDEEEKEGAEEAGGDAGKDGKEGEEASAGTGPTVLHLDLTNTITAHATAGSSSTTAHPMAIPCMWPSLLTGTALAVTSVASQLERDGAPLAAALATAFALGTALHHPAPAQLAEMLGRPLPYAQRRLLPWLPAHVVAMHLQGAAAGGNSSAFASPAAPASSFEACYASALAAAQAFVLRSPGTDSAAREAWVAELSQQCAATAQLLGSPPYAVAVADLASLVSQCVSQLLAHPVTAALRAVRAGMAAAVGPAAEQLLALQPLDPRYCHVAVAATAWAVPASEVTTSDVSAPSAVTPSSPAAADSSPSWLMSPQESLLLLQWRALAAAVPQAAVQQYAAAGAEVALAAGQASAYQMSHWRASRPEERALRDAPHPLVDVLAPTFAAITDLEVQLLSLSPAGASQGADAAASMGAVDAVVWTEPVAAALALVAHWRAALWAATHGPAHQRQLPASYLLQQQVGGLQGGAQALLDEEQVTWVWRHLDKALVKLGGVLPQLAGTPLGNKLAHAQAAGASALGLDTAPSKPLLWRQGGRPLLPRARALLQARLDASAAARACAGAAGGAAALAVGVLGALDARGFPSALVACGADPTALVESALAEIGADGLAPGSDTEGGEIAVRMRVSAAIASTLCVDPVLRKAAASGLALVAFAPVTAAVTAALRLTQKAGAGEDASAEQQLVVQGREVVAELCAAIVRRAEAAAKEACTLEGKTHADALAAMSASLLASAVTAAPAVAPSGKLGGKRSKQATASVAPEAPPVFLLPATLMASPVCRQLQRGLLVLHDVHSIRAQLPWLAQATLSLSTWAAHALQAAAAAHESAPGSALPRPLLMPPGTAAVARQLMSAARNHMMHGVAATGRNPCDFAAHQQLVWVLDMVASWPSTAASAVQARQWHYLLSSVLPAVLHELWLSWQSALWATTASAGPLLAGRPLGDASKAAADPSAAAALVVAGVPGDVAPARLLHAATRASAAVSLVTDIASEVQARGMRLAQLRAAALHLATSAASDSARSGVSAHVAASPAAADHIRSTWSALGGLLAQVMLAHTSSLPTIAARQHLTHLVQQLLSAVSHGACHQGQQYHTDSSSLVAEFATLLRTTHHQRLASVLDPLLLPALELLLSNCDPAADGEATSAAARLSTMAAQGTCWALLGAARLQLVAPPAGIDPAGKYALKARHLREGVLLGELGPQRVVRTALDALPGGPDESAHLQDLDAQHVVARASLSAALALCVPRPQPPQYAALASEVKGFIGGLGSMDRVLTMMKALQNAASAPAPSAAAATKPKRGKKGGAPAPAHAPAAAAAAAAQQEAGVWCANAGAWAARLGSQYAPYLDIVQPVQLAVQELRHGLSLMAAAAPISSTPIFTHAQAGIPLVVSSLLSFPLPAHTLSGPTHTQGLGGDTPQSIPLTRLGEGMDAASDSSSAAAAATGSESGPAALIADVAAASAKRRVAHLEPVKARRATEMAGYTARLQAGRVALHALARHLLSAGSAALAAHAAATSATEAAEAAAPGTGAVQALGNLESLFTQFVAQWSALKAYEERVAAEEEEMFKTKTKNTTILTEEVGV